MHEYLGYLISALLGAVGGGVVTYLYVPKLIADLKKELGIVKKVI